MLDTFWIQVEEGFEGGGGGNFCRNVVVVKVA